jgi:hypothetical protein
MRASALRATATLLLGAPATLAAQDWLGVRAILDLEGWHTGGRSNVLTRDEPWALVLRGFGLAIVEPHPSWQLIAGVEAEAATDAPTDSLVELEVEQLALRFTPSPLYVFDVGKFAFPIGTFAPRRFSTTNPLIGRPDGYPVIYPWGVQISGTTAKFDYRAAIVSLPVTNELYLPTPGQAARPAVSIGVTPIIGLRLGASWTAGPYLGPDVSGDLPSGTEWQDYGEMILAADLKFARGYFELFAELGASWYEAPTYDDDVKGTTYYIEAKYSFHPRFFTAARFERNLYAFIRPFGGGTWVARTTDFVNTEVGAGFRINPRFLAKFSGRWDDWEIPPGTEAFLGEGFAIALQLSYRLGG